METGIRKKIILIEPDTFSGQIEQGSIFLEYPVILNKGIFCLLTEYPASLFLHMIIYGEKVPFQKTADQFINDSA